MTQAWPKGKMIEGRSGGSGRGTRRELWAPPDSGSSTSGSYVVSCTDARPSPPTHFLPSAASSPSHLPAGHGEKFRRTRAHVQLGTGLRRMAGPKGKRSKGGAGDLGGALEENCGPHLTAVLQPADRTLYRVPTLDPRRPLISFPPPLPHPSHLPAGHGEKFCRTQAHVQLGTRLRRMAGPKGK